MDKNQEALSLAYKKAKAKSLKVKELLVAPEMSEIDIDTLIVKLAKAKAEETDKAWSEHIKGQRWYVVSLVEFSGMSAQERLDHEYELCFSDVASEAEMLAKLDEIVA